MKVALGFLIFAFLFLASAKEIFAIFSFQVTNVNPIEVSTKNQEIQITIQVNSLPSGDSYFRAGIESGSTSIGYMKNNNGDWVKLGTVTSDKENNQCTNYFKISADGQYVLSIKVGDDNEIQNGSKAIKAYRFTTTCGSSIPSSEEPNLVVNIALPTPSPSPTPSPTPTPTPSKTPSPTPTPTKTPSLTPKPSPTKSPSPKPQPTADRPLDETSEPAVLTASTESPEPSATPELQSDESPKFPILAIPLIVGGLGFVGVAAYPFLKGRARINSD